MMMRMLPRVWLASLTFLTCAVMAVGCAGPAPGDATAGPETAASTPVAADDHAHADATEGAQHETLALRDIMRRLETVMTGVDHALWLGDFSGIRDGAAAVAEHPHVAPEEMQRIQGILGTAMARFAAADHAVHEAAVHLGQAAGQHDMTAVLQDLHAVRTGCVACHTAFRERVRAQ